MKILLVKKFEMNIDLIDLKKINSNRNKYNINTIEINSIRIILSIK